MKNGIKVPKQVLLYWIYHDVGEYLREKSDKHVNLIFLKLGYLKMAGWALLFRGFNIF